MPKINCPKCEGTGTYTWVDSGYGTDRYYDEPCDQCARTGRISIEVPVRVYKKFGVKLWSELEFKLNLFETIISEKQKQATEIKLALSKRKK